MANVNPLGAAYNRKVQKIGQGMTPAVAAAGMAKSGAAPVVTNRKQAAAISINAKKKALGGVA